jgi:hypothetical protein
MVCIILFDEVFYKIVPWEDWSSALFLVGCKWYPCSVWIGLICDYTSLPSKEPDKISYEEWRALRMDISVAQSGLSVVLRSSCCACADCCSYAYCLGDMVVVCSAVA